MPMAPQSSLDSANVIAMVNHRELLCDAPNCRGFREASNARGSLISLIMLMVHGTADDSKTLMNKCPQLAATTECLPIAVVN